MLKQQYNKSNGYSFFTKIILNDKAKTNIDKHTTYNLEGKK